MNPSQDLCNKAAFLSQAGEVLVQLEGRDALAHALAWLRQIAYETPTRSGLDNQLAAVLRNQHLNARQRCGVEILQAHVFKAQRNLTAARAALRDTLEMAARSGSMAPLFEERPFLADLIQNKRIRDYLDASPACRQVLRRLQQTATDFAALGQPHGLTRREVRVLAAICEGASNKFIANALGLTESTVKFHLSNVYRKLGVANRKQAMRVAGDAR